MRWCGSGCFRLIGELGRVRAGIEHEDPGADIVPDVRSAQARGLGGRARVERPDQHPVQGPAVAGLGLLVAGQLRAHQGVDHPLGVGLAGVAAEGDRVSSAGGRRREHLRLPVRCLRGVRVGRGIAFALGRRIHGGQRARCSRLRGLVGTERWRTRGQQGQFAGLELAGRRRRHLQRHVAHAAFRRGPLDQHRQEDDGERYQHGGADQALFQGRFHRGSMREEAGRL